MCIYPTSDFAKKCGEVVTSPLIWNSTHGIIDQVNMQIHESSYNHYALIIQNNNYENKVVEILISCIITAYERSNC